MDGTLYDWHLSVYNYFKNFKNYTGTWTEFWTVETKKLDDAWWKFLTENNILYSDRPPTDDCMYLLDWLKDRYEIFYITSRPDSVKLTTEQYLRRYKFPYQENLIFNKDKASEARLHKIVYALDDFPASIDALSTVCNVVVMAKPWNREYWDKFPTIHNLKEFSNCLEVFNGSNRFDKELL